ncbi:MAG: glycosyltransferase family 2 [Trebouxia sp. A1-2]|nr:MAG: glycosyltransferase family 2 [Trebouxia sp. A1-2]
MRTAQVIPLVTAGEEISPQLAFHCTTGCKVLDDSTDRITRELVDDKLMEWLEHGFDIEVLRRTNRAGYKAGALKEGLQRLQDFDFVAIFDADFKPDSDFLIKTIPHLMLNLHLGFVQTRWTFTNADESYLTKLPASFFAYRKQQHRWTCGPVQLWRKAAVDIWASSLPLFSKMDLIICYFGIRKFATHWVSAGFFCGLVPLSVFTPEVSVPLWALVHIPVLVTLTTAAFTPRGWIHCIHFVLFENAMGLVRLGAVIAGTLDTKRASEWVVTTKLGASDRRPGTAAPLPQVRTCRFYAGEMAMSVFVLTAAFYGMISMHRLTFSFFLVLQGLAFLAFGLNMVDCGNLLGRRLRPARPAAKKVTFSDDGLVATHPVDRTFTL